MQNKILVTGGAGFIGSNFVRYCVSTCGLEVCNVDKLTYAGNLGSLSDLQARSGYSFTHVDINDAPAMRRLLLEFRPFAIVHFAAESHVDRSILDPDEFIQTNIHGTFALLEEAKAYWNGLAGAEKGSVSIFACVDGRSVRIPDSH